MPPTITSTSVPKESLLETLEARLNELPAFVKFLGVLGQLGLLVVASHLYGIQDDAFNDLLKLTWVGFIVHSALPMRLRLPFFALLSATGIVLVLGPQNAAYVMGIGLGLIGICHLKIAIQWRALLLIGVGIGFAFMRVDLVSSPWSGAIWPILCSMFMFRLIIYLYDMHHEKTPDVNPARTFSYFFMLPNVCFPLFPVVDYKRFTRGYYNEDAIEIYQRGVTWMYRGAVHLVLYRVVYHFLVVDTGDVEGLSGVLHFSLSAFLLYLQVSGQFHIIVGMMLLFGFNLPETHHLYYFAQSFTDFWRRIRTDWKDFMMKIFYYPIHFRLRKYGEMPALVMSTILVFILTWLLHAYQWFWLRGTPLVELHDILFWTVFAMLVLGTSILETTRGRRRTLNKGARNGYDLAAVVLNTLGTFLTITVLWGLWSSGSVTEWYLMWQTAGMAGVAFLAMIPAIFVGGWYLGKVAAARPAPAVRRSLGKKSHFARSAFMTGTGLVVLCLLWQGQVYSQLPRVAGNVLETIREDRLNERDRTARQIGYYEHLTHGRHNSELWATYNKQPADWGWDAHPGARIATTDLRGTRFAPNLDIVLKGAPLTTNSWGMRDKEYAIEKPAGTYRIGLLGASNVFGVGVADDETFDAFLEERIAAQSPVGMPVEVLNFSVPEGEGTRYAAILDMDMLKFDLDAIILFEHMDDASRSARVLFKGPVKSGMPIPYPELASIVQKTGVNADMTTFEALKRLGDSKEMILDWTHRHIAGVAQDNDIELFWALLPKTFERLSADQVASRREAAEATGMRALDLLSVYDGRSPESLRIAEWDSHGNGEAHELIADRLYEQLFVGGDGAGPLLQP